MIDRRETGIRMYNEGKVKRVVGGFEVQSETAGNGVYIVLIVGSELACTCMDFRSRGRECKHIWAAKEMRREHVKQCICGSYAMTVREEVFKRMDGEAHIVTVICDECCAVVDKYKIIART